MIGALAGVLGGLGLPARAVRPLAWALTAITAGLLIWGAVALFFDRHDAAVVERADTSRQLRVERSARAADASAETRREDRRAAQDTAQREFDDATVHLPPEGLTRRQRLDLCRELQHAGHDVLELAQCADLRSGAQAGPRSAGADGG